MMRSSESQDDLHVKEILRHRNFKNTVIDITVEKGLFETESTDESHIKVAHNLDEARKLMEVDSNKSPA